MKRAPPLFRVLLAFSIAGLAPANWVWGYQAARVPMEGTPVLESPDAASNVVRNIEGGKDYWVSSRSVRGADGASWYRILIDERGTYGYVQAAHVVTEDQAREIRVLGIDEDSPESHSVEPDPAWTVYVRGLGLGAGSLRLGELSVLPGAEVEAGMSLGLKSRAADRHRWGAGVTVDFFDGATAIMGTFVVRPFSRVRIEPEMRLRLGIETGDAFSTAFAVGAALGARYPLSIKPGAHVALYFEGAGVVGLDSSSPILFWLGGGFAFHL